MTLPRGSIAAIALLVSLAGCIEYKIKHDGWEHFRGQIGADPPGGPRKKADPADPTAPPEDGWAILIETFEGPTRFRRSSDLIRRLSNRNAVSDLWYQDVQGKMKVYCGRYETVTDLNAQQALLHLRAIEEDGEKPYEKVEFVSLGSGKAMASSNDLRAYAGQGFYTLQAGFYDDEIGPNFRDAAEAAAAEFRRQGHRAFYYHGPNRSMVTIDLFTDADFEQDGPVRVYGPRIRQLQETFQYNLGNGVTVLETVGEGKKIEKRPQPSFVVKVPGGGN